MADEFESKILNSLETFEELIAQVPEGFDWLVRSDDRGGFANLVPKGYLPVIGRDNSEKTYPTWGDTPLSALKRAIIRATKN